MPSIAGMLSSIGPTGLATGVAPRSQARLKAAAASRTRKAIAQAEGPCSCAKRWPKPSGSALMMKLMSPCVQRDVLGAMAGHHREAHALEQRAQQDRIGRGVLDELEAVGAHRVVEKVGHGRPRHNSFQLKL